MKVARFVMVVLFLTSLLQAQVVKPTSLTLVAVPGYSSSPQTVAFFNTGDTELALTISITGPFSIPTNKCGGGVKPGVHCNVYVIYTPTGIETDTGTLGFTFNGQTVSVALTGDGVSIIPTSMKVQTSRSKLEITVHMSAEKDLIPNGEEIWVNCIADENPDQQAGGSGPLEDNKAIVPFVVKDGYQGKWQCGAQYLGDPEFAPSGVGFPFDNQNGR